MLFNNWQSKRFAAAQLAHAINHSIAESFFARNRAIMQEVLVQSSRAHGARDKPTTNKATDAHGSRPYIKMLTGRMRTGACISPQASTDVCG